MRAYLSPPVNAALWNIISRILAALFCQNVRVVTIHINPLGHLNTLPFERVEETEITQDEDGMRLNTDSGAGNLEFASSFMRRMSAPILCNYSDKSAYFGAGENYFERDIIQPIGDGQHPQDPRT